MAQVLDHLPAALAAAWADPELGGGWGSVAKIWTAALKGAKKAAPDVLSNASAATTADEVHAELT